MFFQREFPLPQFSRLPDMKYSHCPIRDKKKVKTETSPITSANANLNSPPDAVEPHKIPSLATNGSPPRPPWNYIHTPPLSFISRVILNPRADIWSSRPLISSLGRKHLFIAPRHKFIRRRRLKNYLEHPLALKRGGSRFDLSSHPRFRAWRGPHQSAFPEKSHGLSQRATHATWSPCKPSCVLSVH